MPVAAPGRWVKGESKSLLGGTRPRTPAPGESARAPENAKGAEYRSTPIARHEGDRRGSPWFSWRAIALGCVLGALAVLAVLRAFPSVAAAVVPAPEPAVAAPRRTGRAEPSSSRALEPSAKPASRATESFADIVRAHHAKHLEDARTSSERLPRSSGSKLGTRADADETPGLGEKKTENAKDDVRRRRRRRVEREGAFTDEEHADTSSRTAAPRRAAAVEPKRLITHTTERRDAATRVVSKRSRSRTHRVAMLGDAAPDAEHSAAASVLESSAGGAWRSGLARDARPAFVTPTPSSNPEARLGAVATAEAASRGEASAADVGDALVDDVRDSAASALRFEAGLGREARETRRDVEGEAFLAQRRAEAQSVDPAGDALAQAREGVARMREVRDGILNAGDERSRAARRASDILGGDPASSAEAVANDPLVQSVFGLSMDA